MSKKQISASNDFSVVFKVRWTTRKGKNCRGLILELFVFAIAIGTWLAKHAGLLSGIF
jgi:hypothetical protein